MTAKRHASALEQNLLSLVDQLAYLIDELSAQKAFIKRLPVSIMLATSIPGALSIKDRYLEFLEREEYLNLPVIAGLIDGTLVGKEMDKLSEPSNQKNMKSLSVLQIVERISETRAGVIELLRGADEDEWLREVLKGGQKVDLRTWAYNMAIQDADDLREIGIQFSEQRLTFSIKN